MLIISTIVFTVIGYAGKNNIYSEYKIDYLKTPQLVAVFQGVGNEKYPWMIEMNNRNYNLEAPTMNASIGDAFEIAQSFHIINSPISIPDKNVNGGSKEPVVIGGNKGTQPDKETKPDNTTPSGNKDDEGNTINEPDTSDNGNEDMDNDDQDVDDGDQDDTKNPDVQFQTVNEDYFADALFIGDSRTVGLSEYSGWTKPTFYADEGMSIYNVFTRKIVNLNGNDVTILNALKVKQYKKVYIMLGINELGTGTTKSFVNKYNEVISQIRELQPDSIIYIEGIMNVGKHKSDTDPIFNNVNIDKRNKGLSCLANNKNIFYIDVNEDIADQGGNVPDNYTFDSIHLKAAYYKIWTGYLEKHAVIH